MWGNKKPPPPQPLPPPDGSQQQPEMPRGASGVSQQFEAMDVTPTTVTPTTVIGDGAAGSSSGGAKSQRSGSSAASSSAIGHATLGGELGLPEKKTKKGKPAKYIQGENFLYRIGDTLGKGSYAKVKECDVVDDLRPQRFAVKIFKVSLLKRRKMWDSQEAGFKTAFDDVLREIYIMKRLTHENVMNLHDVIDDPNATKLYMVMDFCPKGAIMETEKMPCPPLAMADARRWFVDSCVGLDYLHFQGVVHYDLKPDNILIASDGRAVISDFGVSRVHPNKSDTTVGSPGTPTYTAPEVWGVGGYAGKVADVWSLGVTLHAFVFGCLPYPALNQQELIAMVTDPAEWTCQHACEDAELLALITGMMQKVPTARMTLEQVESSPWIASACALRAAADTWEKIEVDEAELAKAIISGHVDTFRRTKTGTLVKKTDASEGELYGQLHASEAAAWIPTLFNLNQHPEKGKVLLELEDLTTGLQQPCLMDIKMGMRTFTEADAHSSAPRKDLLEKMLKAAPDAATDEERRVGVVKLRYLQFREQSTSTRTLGFRVDAVQLADTCDCTNVPSPQELRLIATREQVKRVIAQYLQRRRQLLASFLEQLRELRRTLEGCELFMVHQFVRTSVLLVYDAVTEQTKVRMIDFPRVSPTSRLPPAEDADEGDEGPFRRLDHRTAWVEGNEEDGYLTGLDNMIACFEELLGAEM